MGNISKQRDLIVKSNRLIEASYRLSTQEQRLILLMASMIKPEDKDFHTYQIKVRDFNHIVGIKGEGGYDKTKDVTRRLLERVLNIKKEKSLLQINWLSSAEYFGGKGYVELSFDPKLKPYLLQLKEFFTQYRLKDVVRLKRSYSIRIYELLKQYESIGKRSLDLSELRRVLGLQPNEYKQYGHLKSRILKPAQKELEKSTDLKFAFKEKKQGRRVSGIVFHIQNNRRKKAAQEPEEKQDTDSKAANPELNQRLREYFCLSENQAEEVLRRFSKDRILENLAYVEDKQKKDLIDNIGPYTFKAINDDYRLQISLFDVEKEEKEAQQRKKQIEEELSEKLNKDYEKYRKGEVAKIKKGLPEAEIKEIESSLKEELKEKYGKDNIALKKLIEVGVTKRLAERAGVIGREEWIKQQKEKRQKTG